MKNTLLLLIGFFTIGGLFAQSSTEDNKVTMIPCTGFKLTKPLRELIAEQPANATENENKEKKEADDRLTQRPMQHFELTEENALPNGEDPALQKTPATRTQLTSIVNFAGQSGTGTPPDPTGSVSATYFVQAVNSVFRVYHKTGITAGASTSLGNILFGSLNGDPCVLYDKYADRWVITEFGASGNQLAIAVSQTNDPLGAFYSWQFTSPQFPDYLKLSIWQDGYYMTSNQGTQKVYCFDRVAMLAGTTSARGFYKTFSPPTGNGFFCPLPADADGQLPPAGTPCPIFTYSDNGWGGSNIDAVNVFEMAVNWVPTTPTATITTAAQLATAAFDASYNSNWDDISQPGTSGMLDGIGGVFTYRAQWRAWTGYNSVLLCNGVLVNSPAGRRSIRWYELRQNTTGAWSIYQQSTYGGNTGTDSLNRWVGSMAMDDNGSIALCYATSGVTGSTNVYPSLRYTGRLATDPLNTMTFTETTAKVGTGSQTSGNRFGDYSHTSLDPDGITFWHTGEYIGGTGTNGSQRSQIYSFQIPIATGIVNVANNVDLTVFYANDLIKIKAGKLPTNDILNVDLFDATGKLIEGKTVAPFADSFESSFITTGLSKGVYLVRIGKLNSNFQKVTKVVVE